MKLSKFINYMDPLSPKIWIKEFKGSLNAKPANPEEDVVPQVGCWLILSYFLNLWNKSYCLLLVQY